MTIIIPAYRPDEKLILLLKELKNVTSARLLVVNDGSGAEFDHIFEAASPLCDKILIHPVNRGKGAALKTAFSYLLEKGVETECVCTADVDGQHLPEDIIRCLDAAKENPDALVLGARKFDGSVPARSRFGNTVSRFTFRILMGKTVYDTQTGLRAFSPSLLPQMLEIAEDRYEYEMKMLCNAVRKKTPIVEVEISTVYIEENKSSHFNPLKDALKVYGLLLRCALGPFFQVISFLFSSCLAYLVDVVAYFLLFRFVFPIFLGENTRQIAFFALLIARVISSLTNYLFNGKVVFKSAENPAKSLTLYTILSVLTFFAHDKINALLLIGCRLHAIVSHILSQVIFFPASFLIQKYIVFPRKKEKK
ncbi:MAG: bifunctional glycosyltransferase family 2/GtrA family protein [Clostridia bacterium]|nr:bifunctional glycosyltransferase family 2/GtrA family protein [Clostridia bacterium]